MKAEHLGLRITQAPGVQYITVESDEGSEDDQNARQSDGD